MCVLGATAVLGSDVAVCPGEGGRYGDHKCNHDPTHRVCAQLLDADGSPSNWGKGNFWEITGQTAFQWDDDIKANNGDSWCICMWATASLIEAAGCENIHIHCESTDVSYVLAQYQDGGTDLSPAHSCLQQKCPSAFERKEDATIPSLTTEATGHNGIAIAGAFCLSALVLAGLFRRRTDVQSQEEGASIE